jgi:exodeoxyribonuclease V alpha subunit
MSDFHSRTGQNRNPAHEVLKGQVEGITFHNEENGYCVLRIKLRESRELVNLVGYIASISAGEYIEARGGWVNDSRFGHQFRADLLHAVPPETTDAIERYLSSGMIKGLGPKYAGKLVQAFGDKVFDVIEHEPARLREIDGIGKMRAQVIVDSFHDQKAVREIMMFLSRHGIGTQRAVRIYKTYGAKAMDLISANPYRLATDIRGIGFKMADNIAMSLGIERTSPMRARAGISYVLSEAMSEGHCGLPRGELYEMAEKLLQIPDEIIDEALDHELGEHNVLLDRLGEHEAVFLRRLYEAEHGIAGNFKRLTAGDPPWEDVDLDEKLPELEKQTGLIFADSQIEALRLALTSRVLVITGGPGVGKTTLINTIIKLVADTDLEITLCAPTGRAAKRMSETTGMEAKTIHRLLESDPSTGGFRRDEEDPLSCDYLICDETSMVDVPLMYALTRALPDKAALLLVGDIDQLPSVGPGQVLGDIINSGTVPVVELTEVFRQARESRIIRNAHKINNGEMPDLDKPSGDSDFYFIEATSEDKGREKIIELVSSRVPRGFGLDPMRDVQILTPMNRGGLGTRSLNIELQQVLNAAKPGQPFVQRFGWTYRPGDKVMQTTNDYDREVFNGDLGFIVSIDETESEMVIDFDGRQVKFDFSDLDNLTLAYATTIHKSQGSEYPAIIMVLTMQHFPMLERNLIYTGVTRGRKLVLLVGEKRAIEKAVKGDRQRHRWTRLKQNLMEIEQNLN